MHVKFMDFKQNINWIILGHKVKLRLDWTAQGVEIMEFDGKTGQETFIIIMFVDFIFQFVLTFSYIGDIIRKKAWYKYQGKATLASTLK